MGTENLNAFERILASLHEAALDPARWPGASALIDEALGTHGSTLASGDGDSEEDYRIHFMWTLFRGERHPELERLWIETYHLLDEGVPRLRRRPFNELLHITSLYTDEELKTSASYQALRTRAHAGHAINVRLHGSGGTRILWQVNDPVDGEGWSTAQLDSIRRLLPHVRQTVRVRQALSGAGAPGATLSGMLDARGLGVLQLDVRGRIVAANDHARELLRTGDGLLDGDGLLFARMPGDNDNLQELLGRALPTVPAPGAGGSMFLRRQDGLSPLILHVNPVARQKADHAASPVAALVLVVDPAGGTGIDPAVVSAALDLTATESEVAIQLTRGSSVKQIAAATGRKESTIRFHVKQIFAKHGLSRQRELEQLVRSLAGAPEVHG